MTASGCDRRRGSAVGALAMLLLVATLPGCRPGERFQVEQRSRTALPGLEGRADVRVGDIRRGRDAYVSVVGPEDLPYESYGGETLRQGEGLEFTIDGRRYKLWVDRYDDYGWLDVRNDTAHLRLESLE